jgi:uncharacterized protein
VDTWAWYALADAADADHDLARVTNEQLLEEDAVYVTTNLVFAEALTLIRYRLGHSAALRFGRSIQQLAGSGVLEYLRVDDSHDAAAWEIFERYADHAFSYTDCTSFAVMRATGLTRAFTADRHFAVLGFGLVP